jgi:hypothetical protein
VNDDRFAEVKQQLDDLVSTLRQPNRDMSEVIASIHVSCMVLELREPGLWWDFDQVGMRLRHIAVIDWMERYGFTQMADLPPEALNAFNISLKRRLEFLDRALPHA